MPVCFFYSNYKTKYSCEYEIKDGTIEIAVDYDISDEIEPINGMKIFGCSISAEPLLNLAGRGDFAERRMQIPL